MHIKLGLVPQLWKTSCMVPVPKTTHLKIQSSFRPVALTSHLMNTVEKLVLGHICSIVGPSMNPLQFIYQPNIRVEGGLIFSHLGNLGSTVKILLLCFSIPSTQSI